MGVLKRGLPIVALVVVIAWALFAVAMLTGTLISAQQIDNRVVAINTVYPKVDQNLKSVALALETARVAGEIDKAAKPVEPQFVQILDAVGKIQTSADSVLKFSGQINGSVKTINVAVRSITAAVVPIGDKLSTINDRVHSIKDSAKGIDDKFDDVLDRSRSIDDGAAGINRRARDTTDEARDIRDNLDRLTDTLLPKIFQNSAAIAGSPLLLNNSLPVTVTKLLRGLDPLRLLANLAAHPVPQLHVPALPAPANVLGGDPTNLTGSDLLLGRNTDHDNSDQPDHGLPLGKLFGN